VKTSIFPLMKKLEIALKLDDMGFHYIEGGWPGSNPRDMAFFKLAQRASFKKATLTAFGATRRPGLLAEADKNLQALLESQTAAVALFGNTWDLHVQGILGITLEENLAMIRESVSFIRKNGRAVIYDAEHFFDGYQANPEYAIETLLAALEGGAEYLVLCDTNGGTLPHQITDRINTVKKELAARTGSGPDHLPFDIGIHCHNDCGVAVANSVAAIHAGANMVHGTINGYGERCGNADLTAIVPILCLKMGLTCMPAEKLAGLKKLSRFVSETANMIPVNSRPFVGESAFAHKGGIHVSAVMKDPRGYEHMDPELVGNRRRVLVSDLSGKSNIEYKARELGIDLNGNGFDSQKIVSKIKAMEQQGYEFDVADGSFKILVEKFTRQFKSLFDLESFRITVEKDKDKPCTAHATIKIAVDDQYEITAAEGAGPVSALDNALRKALDKFYPHLDAMRLVDFKVRVIDGRAGTAAKVRVLIESRDQNDVWSTIGVSEDIMEASWMALADSFQYKLSKQD